MRFCAFVPPTPLSGPRSATSYRLPDRQPDRLPDRLPDRPRGDRSSSRFNTTSALAAPPSPSRPLRRSRSNLHLEWITPASEPTSAQPSSPLPVYEVRDVAGPDGLTPAQRWEAEMDKLRTNPRQAPDMEGIAAAGISRSLSMSNISTLASTPASTSHEPPSTANLTNAQRAYYERINSSWGFTQNSAKEDKEPEPKPARGYTQGSSTFSVWSSAPETDSSKASVSDSAPVFSARMDRLSRVVAGEAAPVPDVAPFTEPSPTIKPDVSEAEARWRRLAVHATGEDDLTTGSSKAASSKSDGGNVFSRAVSNIVDKVVDRTATPDKAASAPSANASSSVSSPSSSVSASLRGGTSASSTKSTSAAAPAATAGGSQGSRSSTGSTSVSSASVSRAQTKSSPKTVVGKQKNETGSRRKAASAKSATPAKSAASEIETRAQVQRQQKANSVRARGLSRRDVPADEAGSETKATGFASKATKMSKTSGPVAGVKKRESRKKGKARKSKKKITPIGGPMAIGTSVDGAGADRNPTSVFSFTVMVLFTMFCLYLGERFSHLLNFATHGGLF